MIGYELKTPGKNEGRKLSFSNHSYSSEYIRENSKLSLWESYVDEGYGKFSSRYRLCSKEPMRLEDSLEYDIPCPHCGGILSVCGEHINSTRHALYKCRNCEKQGDKG